MDGGWGASHRGATPIHMIMTVKSNIIIKINNLKNREVVGSNHRNQNNMQKQIEDTLVAINSTERYTQENKNAWSKLFTLAKTKASQLKRRTKNTVFERDIDPSIIVDQWIAEFTDAYVSHSSPQDDKQCGDMSCTQAMEAKAKEDAIEALQQIYSDPNNTTVRSLVKRQLANMIKETSPNLSAFIQTASDQWILDNASTIVDTSIRYTSCDITAYEVFTDDDSEWFDRSNIHFNEHSSLEESDQNADSREYAYTFYQEEAVDRDDARFLGTPPKSDNWDDKMRSNHIDRRRGSRGVLNGLYETTRPEPSYRTKEARNRLMHTLLDSDNKIHIEQGARMTGLNKKRREQLIESRLDALEIDGHVLRLD